MDQDTVPTRIRHRTCSYIELNAEVDRDQRKEFLMGIGRSERTNIAPVQHTFQTDRIGLIGTVG